MKKLLLALFAAVLAVTASAQTTVTFVAGTDKTSNTSTSSPDEITKDGITIAFTEGTFGRTDNYRCYANETMTVSSTIGNIASIEFTCTASGSEQYGPGRFTAKEGTYTNEGKIGTWTGDAESVTFTASSSQVRMSQIVVTTAAAEGTVAKPVIKPASGTYYGDQNITMTAAEGCTIKYTIEGDQDEKEYTYGEYDALILNAGDTYTINAWAEDADGKKSDVVTNTYVIKEIVNYNTVTGLRQACKATSYANAAEVTFTFENLLVTGVSGKNIFVNDGSNSYLLYAENAKSLKKGDKITGKVAGKLYKYNGLGELAVEDGFENITIASSDNEVSALSIAIDDAVSSYSKYEAEYVKFANVTFQAEAIGTTYGADNYKSVAIEDEAGDQINIYDVAGLFTDTKFYTTQKYDVYCYVVTYNDKRQVYVLDANDLKLQSNKQKPDFKWMASEYSVELGGTPIMALTNNSDGNVSYSTSDGKVAVIVSGKITLMGTGTCVITAMVSETDTYLSAQSSFTLHVYEKVGGLETFTNGGFEEWKSDSQPTGWVSTTTTASNATLSKSTDAHSGEYSVCVKNATSNKRLASKEFLLPEGWYTMQFYAKSVADAENKAEARPGYAPWDSKNNKMGSYSYGDYTDLLSTTEWTLVTYTFQLKEQTQINLVVMNPKSSDTATYGDLLIDDFEFREATENEIAATGISAVKAETEDGAIYNVAGQKVDASYKGIVIKNGKKYLNK